MLHLLDILSKNKYLFIYFLKIKFNNIKHEKKYRLIRKIYSKN